MADAHREPEHVADALFQRDRVGVLGRRRRDRARLLRLARRHAFFVRQRFGLPHVESFGDDALRRAGRIGHADQRACVAGRQLAGRDQRLHVVGQPGQPHHVGDVAAALADQLRDPVGAVAELAGERVIALRLLHRVEVLALHVLDDRDLQRVAVADIDRNDRHLVQAGALRCAPAPLADDDLETIGRALHRAHHDRLDHAVLPDGVRQFAKLGVGEGAPRVARIRLEIFDRHLALRARPFDRDRTADIAHQARQPPSQSRPRFIGHHSNLLTLHKRIPAAMIVLPLRETSAAYRGSPAFAEQHE